MLALLSKALLVLIVALLLPTGLVFASQDAVPGDQTYPVKRGLENVIVRLAALHPSTRAFFKTDMANRRYKEAVTLIRRGDQASSESLVELVTQTQAAAEDISQISDPSTKQQLVDNLSKQIVQYKAGLAQLETTAPPVASMPQPPVAQTVDQSPVQPLVPTVTPTSTPRSVQTQAPGQAGTSAQPTVPVRPPTVIIVTATPPPIFVPAPPSVQPPIPTSIIGSAINNLNDIENHLRTLSAGAKKEKEKDEGRNNKDSNQDSGGAKKKSDK